MKKQITLLEAIMMIAIPLFMGVAIFIGTDLLIFQLLSFEISEAFGEWFV
jgi:hypothetical protein